MLSRIKSFAKDTCFELWFDTIEQLSDSRGILIFCHGCPSHPYDHSPSLIEYLSKEENYLLVFLHYKGTWESGGVCNLENSVESVIDVYNYLKEGAIKDILRDEVITLNPTKVTLIGASFGGSVALVSSAKLNVKSVIALAPVIDFKNHNNKGFEENLDQTFLKINLGWKNLWRFTESDWNRLKNGLLDLNSIEYIDKFEDTQFLLVHGKEDKSVDYKKSVNFVNIINKTSTNKADILLCENQGHFGLFGLSDLKVKKKVLEFLKG
ncbi:MAG: alpha/beta hydrolase family protein [Nanobdellota archaeon]